MLICACHHKLNAYLLVITEKYAVIQKMRPSHYASSINSLLIFYC